MQVFSCTELDDADDFLFNLSLGDAVYDMDVLRAYSGDGGLYVLTIFYRLYMRLLGNQLIFI